jgi:hypothetical protein
MALCNNVPIEAWYASDFALPLLSGDMLFLLSGDMTS